jgi:RNA polymerase primary sigma factor
MTATPAVIGLSAGNRLLAASFGAAADLAPQDAHHPSLQFASAASKLAVVVAHRASASSASSSSAAGHARAHAVRALRNHSAPALALPLPLPPPPLPADPVVAPTTPELDMDSEFGFESSLEAIVLLQRSMLEKQWELPFEDDDEEEHHGESLVPMSNVVVARSGVSARQRRMSGRRRGAGRKSVTISPELMQSRNRIYLRGTVSKELLTHKQVVHLSKKIKDGIWLQHQRSK